MVKGLLFDDIVDCRFIDSDCIAEVDRCDIAESGVKGGYSFLEPFDDAPGAVVNASA